MLIAPGRHVLDTLLVDAAVAAGAKLRHPCAPQPHTARLTCLTSTIDDRCTLAANAQPPIPILTSRRSGVMVAAQCSGPDNIGAVMIRIHRLKDNVNTVGIRSPLIGMVSMVRRAGNDMAGCCTTLCSTRPCRSADQRISGSAVHLTRWG